MAYDDGVAQRLREALAERRDIVEKNVRRDGLHALRQYVLCRGQ